MDILALETVRRRFTTLIPAMKGLTYEERLSHLGLYLLEFRRMRGDLIDTYKIIKAIDKIEAGKLFPLVGETKTRRQSLKIRGSRFRTEMRTNCFSQRVANLWNSLPREAVEAASLSTFKTQ